MALRETHDKLKYRAKLGTSSSSRRIRVESEESSHDGDDSAVQRTSHDDPHLDGSRGELKQLQDSLTRFFTPSNRRRSRVAQSSFSLEQLEERSDSVDNDKRIDGSLKIDSDEEKLSEQVDASGKYKAKRDDDWQLNGIEGKRVPRKDHLRPLTVSVDDGARCEGPSSGPKIMSGYSSWKTTHSATSPHRRNDVLYDALSPYFSASSEKRRTFSKGEYAQLSGVRRRGRSGDSSSTQEQISPASAWSMERARTSPEHSSCESIAQAEPSRHDEELVADESSSVERSNDRRRKLHGLPSVSTCGRPTSGEYVDESQKSKHKQHHKTNNTSVPLSAPVHVHSSSRSCSLSSPIARRALSSLKRSETVAPATHRENAIAGRKRLRCSFSRRERTPSPKRGPPLRRESAASAKRIRTPKLPHTPTTSPDAHSGGSHSSHSLRTAKRAHLKRAASSPACRKRVSAASLIRKARSRTMGITSTPVRTQLVKNTSRKRIKPVRSVPGAGRVLRLAVAGSGSKTEKNIPSMRRLSSPHKMKHTEAFEFERPIEASESDLEIFERACVNARKKVEDTSCGNAKRSKDDKDYESASSRRLKRIIIGGYKIDTWYSAPYPEEYSRLTTLHLCEFCMQYMKTEAAFRRHLLKCDLRHPPGNEIYRRDNVSVFEVDGSLSLIYCQNICLLAKLFLDHKTLYYDVEPFLFYVLTRNDEGGFHFVGYFSKEKYSAQKYNLSCIMTLPCYQMRGFGRFLIDFSFLLSRREGMMGTPERPLSDLGRIAYLNYWLSAILEHLHETLDPVRPKKVTVKSIARATGISIFDIVETVEQLGMIEKEDAQNVLCVNYSMVENHWKKARNNPHRLWIDESKLKWQPKEYTPYSPNKDSRMRSPGAAARNLPSSRSPITVETRSLRVTADVREKKNGMKRKCSQSARNRLVFEDMKRPKVPSLKRPQASSDDSSDIDEDGERASPISKNSCKGQSRRRRTQQDSSDGDGSSSAEENADEHARGSKYRSVQGSREARGPTRRSDTGTVRHATDKRTRSAHRSAVSKKQVRSRRAVIEQSSSDSDQSEDGKVQLLSKRSPQKRRKRVRRSVKKVTHIVKTPSRESSVDTVETVAMLAGDEEDGAREVESVMDVSSQNDEAKREARERSSGAEGSTELERWAESIGVSSSSSSIRCCYSPPAESTGSEATEKSFDRVVMTGEQIAESENITSKHETEEGCNEDGEDRRSLSRCDVELAVNNDDELPPTLEADGDMPLWHRSPVDSPEPVVMEVSFATSDPNSSETGGSGEGSHSPTEMPQLRASAAGTESIYDGEDEDAPPRLSPNFAPTEVAEENSLSGSETIPQWADGGTTVDGGASLKKRSIRETVDSSPPHLARSSSTNTPPKSLLRTTSAANNTCEMVNLGGDAGSEGDTSESEGAERVPRASLDSGSRTVCEVATLDAEPSALDRPPKAPAMLTQPIEEHEGNSFGDGPNTFAKKRPQPLSSAIICGQPRSNVSERSPVAPVNAPLSGGVSSQHFMSPAPCSIQQHTPTGPHQCLTPHQQTDMCNASPGSSVYLSAAAPEGAPLHSSPTTPLRIASQQPHEASAFGSPSVSKRCDEPTMQQPSSSHPMVSSAASSSASKTTPTPVVAPALSQPPLAQNGQRRGTSKKELNRCAKQQQQSSSGALMVAPRGSMQASAAPVAPTTAVAPYMLATPATHQQMTHQLGASAHSSHSQPPAAYYQGSYGHAGSASTHFESQFYAGSFAASGSTAGSYAGTPAGSYPMNMVTMAKSHSVSTAMHNSFSYNYQSGIQPTRSAMLGGTGAQSSSPDSSPAMLGTQCAAVQNGNAAASASWRYANSSAAFGGNGFMDAFGGGVPPSGGNGQFPLPNQLYPQQYYSYLMPMMRND